MWASLGYRRRAVAGAGRAAVEATHQLKRVAWRTSNTAPPTRAVTYLLQAATTRVTSYSHTYERMHHLQVAWRTSAVSPPWKSPPEPEAVTFLHRHLSVPLLWMRLCPPAPNGSTTADADADADASLELSLIHI